MEEGLTLLFLDLPKFYSGEGEGLLLLLWTTEVLYLRGKFSIVLQTH